MKTNTTFCPGRLWRVLCAPLLAIAVLLSAKVARGEVNLYVCSAGDHAVKKVSSTGAVSTFAALPGNSFPTGIAVDGSGNLYAANYNPAQISKITPTGAVSLFATLPGNLGLAGLAFDRGGNLFAADAGTGQISKIAPDGTVSRIATLGTLPLGLAFDGSGNLYVAGYVPARISKITPGGAVSTFATLPTDSGAYGLAFDARGNLYVSQVRTNQISKFTPGGTVSLFATLPAGSSPIGLAFDGSGNLHVANDGTGTISKISPDGLTVSTFATGIANPAFIAFAPLPVVPDLRVTNIVITNNKGPKVTITATVSNTGTAAAGASTAMFLDGVAVIAGVNTPAIPAGGSVDVAVDWNTASENGIHTLHAIADGTNVVAESNETNNSADVTVDIRGNKALFWQFLFPE